MEVGQRLAIDRRVRNANEFRSNREVLQPAGFSPLVLADQSIDGLSRALPPFGELRDCERSCARLSHSPTSASPLGLLVARQKPVPDKLNHEVQINEDNAAELLSSQHLVSGDDEDRISKL